MFLNFKLSVVMLFCFSNDIKLLHTRVKLSHPEVKDAKFMRNDRYLSSQSGKSVYSEQVVTHAHILQLVADLCL